jgi:hypothetical protein
MRSETWKLHLGRLQDPPDGTPAWRQFRPDGTVEEEAHWQAGVRQS